MKLIKTTSCFLVAIAALTFTNVASAKEKLPEKETGLEYQVSKSTLYNQLSYDLGKHGYTLVWDLSEDSHFTPHVYNSDRDEITYALNTLNDKVGGSFDDGNYVQGLICKEKKQVVFTYSRYTKGVVDKDGHSCLLISPVKSDTNSASAYGYGATPMVTANPVQAQTQNIPGARIVGN